MEKNKPLSALAYTIARHIPLVGAFSLGLALSTPQFTALAAEGFLHNIRFDQSSRHFVVDTTGSVKATVNTLTIAGRKRVIIDLDNADIAGDLPRDTQLLQDLTAQLPTLKNVTVNQYGGNGRPIVRVLIDLQGDPGSVRLLRNQGPHIELELSDYMGSSPMSGYGGSNSSYGNSNGYGGEHTNSQSPIPGDRSGSSLPKLDQSPYNPSASSGRSISSRITTTQSTANDGGNWVSREQYNQSLRAQQDLKQQVDSLQRQLASQGNGPQLEQMKRTLVVMNQRYDQLEQENKSLRSKVSSNSSPDNKDDSRQKLADLNNQYQQLKQDKLLQGQQLDQLKHDHFLQGQQVQQLALDKVSLSQQISQLKSQVASKSSSTSQPHISDSELQELRRQLSTAQQAMNDSLKTIQEQNQEMAYLRNQVNTVKSGMDAAAREQITSLQNASEQKDKTIDDLRQQLAQEKSTASANGVNAQILAVKSQMENARRLHQIETQNLNKQLQDRNAQIETLHQQLNAVVDKQNNHPSTLDLQQKDARISVLEKSLFQANQQNIANQTLQQKLDEAKAQIAQLNANEQQRQAAERELGDTKSQLARLQTVQKQLDSTQIDLRITRQQLAQMQADESQLKAAHQELLALKAQLDKIKSQQPASKSSSAQKDALAKLTQENQQLSQQLAQVNAQLKTTQQQLASKPDDSGQIGQLQSQVSDLNQQLQQANAQLRAAQSQPKNSGKSTTASSTQVAQLQKQVSDLNQQLGSLRRDNEDLRNSLSSKSSGPSGTNADAEAAYQEAKTAQKAKRTADALDKYKAALLLDPNNSRYAVDYSAALTDDQQYAEAIDALRRYLQRNPGDREAYNQLGKIYLMNDQADAANQAFTRAIPVSTLNNYATSLKKLGKLDDAEKMFKLALSINPKDSEVLFNLGNLYNNQNKLDLARNKYLEAIQIRPDFAEAHYNLGLIFAKLGDNPKAVAHLEKFLELSPNARNAETIRAYVQKLKA